MRHPFALGLIAAALAGCAQHPPQPYVASDMGWSLNTVDGEGLKLAYGEPQSDRVLVMLTCEPGSGQVRVATLAAADNTLPGLALSSRGRSARFAAERAPGLGDMPLLEASVRAADPVLGQFARGGDLAVEVDGRRSALPGDAPRARAFVAACRA
jgi:hypothetical protein